jgi:hypothetical protein
MLPTGGNEQIIELIFSAESACMKSHPDCESLCGCLISITDIACVKPHPVRESLSTSVQFQSLTLPA